MDTFLIKKIQVVRENTDEDNLETEKNSSSSVNASSSFKEKQENPSKKFKGKYRQYNENYLKLGFFGSATNIILFLIVLFVTKNCRMNQWFPIS